MPDENERQNGKLAEKWLCLLDDSLDLGEIVDLPVLSDSMLPLLEIGRKVRIQRIHWNACSVGDIIVFRERRRLTAHRLLHTLRIGGRCYFLQKGDANPGGHFIRAERVVGCVVEYEDDTGNFQPLTSYSTGRTSWSNTFIQVFKAFWKHMLQLIGGKILRQNTTNEYRLSIGDRVLAMRFQPARYAAILRDYFSRASSQGNPHILLDFKIIHRRISVYIDDSLFTSKVLTKRGFDISDGLVRGRYDKKIRYASIRLYDTLTVRPVIRVFEQLLYQAYYSAANTNSNDEFLVHSCAVIHRGFGYLFVGCSGSGKSTVARLSLPDMVLNDEVNLLRFTRNDIEIHSTPFNGFFKEKTEGRSKLKAVLLLKQGPEHKLTKTGGVEVVKTLLREIVPPISLDEVITPAVRAEMLDMADRIRKSVLTFWLEFKKDREFWELIDRVITE